MDPLKSVIAIAASGMRAQGARLKVVSENIANADSTATAPGGAPYRRKTVSFERMIDEATGAEGVRVARIGQDRSPFRFTYDPSHPAADDRGYVKRPNVNTLLEMADMREASRSYEANLNVMDAARAMLSRTVEMLKG